MPSESPLRINCPVLQRLYADPAIDSMIAAAYADALYGVVKRLRPDSVLEIGMAHGGSSLAILTAMEENGAGQLISVDPYQFEGSWKGSGVSHVGEAGFTPTSPNRGS